MEERIRAILATFGRMPVEVSSLTATDDLYRAGLTSHASVNLMLALEDAFDIEFPDALLRKSTFESISAITTAISGLADPANVWS